MSTEFEKSMHLVQNDPRLYNLARSVAHEVLENLNVEGFSEKANRQHIALGVATKMIEQIYRDDAELFNCRLERDNYKKLAVDALSRAPIRMTVNVDGVPTECQPPSHHQDPSVGVKVNFLSCRRGQTEVNNKGIVEIPAVPRVGDEIFFDDDGVGEDVLRVCWVIRNKEFDVIVHISP